MKNKTIYRIGQILTAQKDIELEGVLGEKKNVKKERKSISVQIILRTTKTGQFSR
ncbi:hypothetical protein C810_01517 [Lachnospiraceae bacterium A2]|nr:hypothetical protein C810_01517 [Lachnospiraceae bacterium A2]